MMASFTPVYDAMVSHCYWFERDLWWRSAPAPAPSCLLSAVTAYPPDNDRNSQHLGIKNKAFGKSVQLFITKRNTKKIVTACNRYAIRLSVPMRSLPMMYWASQEPNTPPSPLEPYSNHHWRQRYLPPPSGKGQMGIPPSAPK